MKKYLLTLGLAVLLSACSNQQSAVDETISPIAEDEVATQAGVDGDDEAGSQDMMDKDDMANATEMTIDMFGFGYSQMEISATPGETFEITLTNSGGNHDFDIDELGVDSEVIAEGETSLVTFTIPEDAEPGTEYAYYCSVGNHRAQGMEGTITVE